MGCLLAGATLTIDTDARHRLREPCGECRVAGDVDALLTCLGDAPHDDVVDCSWVESRPLDERLENVGGEIHRMPVLEVPASLASWGSNGIHDHRTTHESSLNGSWR